MCVVSLVFYQGFCLAQQERHERFIHAVPRLLVPKRKEDKELLSCKVYSVDDLTTLVVAKSAQHARCRTQHTHTHTNKGHTWLTLETIGPRHHHGEHSDFASSVRHLAQ